MAEMVTILLFIGILLICILMQWPILFALCIGFFCFAFYALSQGFSIHKVYKMAYSGVQQATSVLFIFCLIGILTALWRASGTIAYIIYYSVPFIKAEYFVLCSFLLCAFVSYLTGTSFGTVSTMGVICMTTGRALGIPAFYLGGAIMSGIYFGDRCSPMSSSALLVCQLTNTNIYTNITHMIKTSIVPFLLTAALYFVTGDVHSTASAAADTMSIFVQNYQLNYWVVLPAVIILVLSVVRVNVRTTMLVSILASVLICIFVQKMGVLDILSCMVMGFQTDDATLAALMNGGGLLSMVETTLIVTVSASYFGIFRNTKLLAQIKTWCYELAVHSTQFAAVLVISILAVALSCNQVLSTMLTCEIAEKFVTDKEKLAIYIENSTILLCGLIPWCIASTFPLSAIGAPTACLVYAAYLYAVPLWNLLCSFFEQKQNS